MKLIPVKQWICDGCKKIIEKPEEGVLVYEESGADNIKARNFKLVHKGKCDIKSNNKSNYRDNHSCSFDIIG